MRLAFRLSWLVNWLLLGLKVLAFVVSGSKAVLASTADSAGEPGGLLVKDDRRTRALCFIDLMPPPPPLSTRLMILPQGDATCAHEIEPFQPRMARSLLPATKFSTKPLFAAVDLASQLVLSVAERSMARYHPAFPIGRGKLEALAVIACACIMSVASLEVAQYSAMDLYNGFAKGALVLLAGGAQHRAGQGDGTELPSARAPTAYAWPDLASAFPPLKTCQDVVGPSSWRCGHPATPPPAAPCPGLQASGQCWI